MQVSANALSDEPSLRIFWVGIGCQRDTSRDLIEQATRSAFRAYALAEDMIAGIATIDTKVNEAGLIAFCRDRNLPLFFYAATVLRSVTVPSPSGAVDAEMGTPSVAEAAAILACWEAGRGGEHGATATQRRRDVARIVLPSPCTLDPTPQLCVPKQRYYNTKKSSAVTIAVARAW